MHFRLLILMLLLQCSLHAQMNMLDSLEWLADRASTDTGRINLKIRRMDILGSVNFDSALNFGKQIVIESKRIGYKDGQGAALSRMANFYSYNGNFTEAWSSLTQSEELLKASDNLQELASLYTGYGIYFGIQSKYDSAKTYFQKCIDIAEKIGDKEMLSNAFQNISIGYYMQSNFPMAINYQQRALKMLEETGNVSGQATLLVNMGNAYSAAEDTVRAKEAFFKSIAMAQKAGVERAELYAYKNLASLIDKEGLFDSAYTFSSRAAFLARKMGDKGIEAAALAQGALFMGKKGRYDEAYRLGREAIHIADSIGVAFNSYQAYSSMGSVYSYQEKYDSAIRNFKKAFVKLEDTHLYTYDVAENYNILAYCYEQTGNFRNALQSHRKYSEIIDSVRRKSNVRKVTELSMEFDFAKKEQETRLEQEKAIARKNAQQLALIIGLASALVLAIISFVAFRNKKRANTLLNRQKEEIEDTLTQLKAAQKQLIQAEKMASLGELTAGIAHEIQNPLNFVNNFSDLNVELLSELNTEMKAGNYKEAGQLSDDILSNEKKINHHGRRAEAIVRGMLQHSRHNTGDRELTNLNALADEYLRLAYHGLRARDKSFNATLKTDYDPAVGKVMINAQDIGRVILNLITNAFYAVNEQRSQKSDGYAPTVSVSTARHEQELEIKVQDNGNGIPERIREKIFQPFFTTKPAGEGTGLGLSLSYDIIKAHQGTLDVETTEGEGTVFTIRLPLNQHTALTGDAMANQ